MRNMLVEDALKTLAALGVRSPKVIEGKHCKIRLKHPFA